MKKYLFLLVGICLVGLSDAWAASPIMPSGSPVDAPANWKTPDSGNTDAHGVLRLAESNKTTNWLSQPLSFESRKLYRSSFKISQFGGNGSGCACCGTEFFNIDFRDLDEAEVPAKEYSVYFFVPDGVDGIYKSGARFAKWESDRGFASSLPKITPVQPVFKLLKNAKNEVLALGNGETLDENGAYKFSSFTSPERTDYDRPLSSTTSTYNTGRWTITKGTDVTYRFALEPMKIDESPMTSSSSIPFVSGKISVNVGYRVSGILCVEVSSDLKNWTKVGEINKVATQSFSLDSFLGSKPTEFFVRFRGVEDDSKYCNLQLYTFSVDLKTEQDASRRFEGTGNTWFSETVDDLASDSNAIDASLWGIDADNSVWVVDGNGVASKLAWDSNVLTKIESDANPQQLSMNCGAPIENKYLVHLKRPMTLVRRVYPYFEQNYTKACEGLALEDKDNSGADLSWCDVDYHVPRDPAERIIQPAAKALMNSAKNDSESLQFVLHATDKPLTGVQARVNGDLTNADGARISADNVQVRYGYYHYVDQPTDSTCAIGWYADALVPFEQGADGYGAPLNVEPNRNFLVWVTVKVTTDVAPGVYDGSVTVTANDGRFVATAPFALNVYDFALPEKNTIDTAYGLSYGNINNYHNLKTEEDRRLVYEKYLKVFSDYRISTYNPTPLDSIKVQWKPDANPPCCELDFSAFDKESKRVFDKYHFTNFVLPFEGLGGGTYEGRYPGSIAGHDETTAEYKSMLADYGHKMQEHLREIGLLDAAYVYCFDEPEEKDYEFVAGQFGKVKKYAPEIKTMLTEEPSEKFSKILKDKAAKVDIWCPLSPNYSNATAKTERENGSKFWWYVCCGPKAPYCTEFTDHPSIELRLWHWQSFERDITGCLIWCSNYWTSSTAFPNSFQNPYEDPASYVSSGTFAPGTKSLWGNGDGRFVYPPLSAATPGRNDGKPIYDAPCASIRWEMIREGVEDYEMLTTLKNLLKEKSSKISDSKKQEYEGLFDFSSFTKDMTHFCVDPQYLHARRLLVMRAIVELQNL